MGHELVEGLRLSSRRRRPLTSRRTAAWMAAPGLLAGAGVGGIHGAGILQGQEMLASKTLL